MICHLVYLLSSKWFVSGRTLMEDIRSEVKLVIKSALHLSHIRSAHCSLIPCSSDQPTEHCPMPVLSVYFCMQYILIKRQFGHKAIIVQRRIK
jgi:hypothetical protein